MSAVSICFVHHSLDNASNLYVRNPEDPLLVEKCSVGQRPLKLRDKETVTACSKSCVYQDNHNLNKKKSLYGGSKRTFLEPKNNSHFLNTTLSNRRYYTYVCSKAVAETPPLWKITLVLFKD